MLKVKKLTIKQKKAIIRLECSNLLSQASSDLFDECIISANEKEMLLNGVYSHGLDKLLKVNEPSYFGSAKAIVEYVREHF